MKRPVCGLIGKTCTALARTHWNKLFLDRGLEAFFDFYRVTTLADLELRLSEMFFLERKGYVVGSEWQSAAVSLMDTLDITAIESQKVDTVINENGILSGFFTGGGEGSDEKRLALWFP